MEQITTVEELNKRIEEYRQKGYNIPGNTVFNQIGEDIIPVLNEVQLDTALPGSQEIRPSSKTGRFEITARGLQKFKNAAYIRFDRPSEMSKTKGETMIAVAGWRFDMAGGIVPTTDAKPINIKAHEEDQRIRLEREFKSDPKKAALSEEKKKAIIEAKVSDNMIRLRKYSKAMAITGAQSRIILKMLGLKSDYAMEELKRPFLIVSAIHRISKEQAAKYMIGIDDLYPAPGSYDVDLVDLVEDEAAAEETSKLLNEYNSLTQEQPQEEDQADAIPFAELSRGSKVEVVKSLLAKKNVKIEYQLDQMTGRELMNLYNQYKEQA